MLSFKYRLNRCVMLFSQIFNVDTRIALDLLTYMYILDGIGMVDLHDYLLFDYSKIINFSTFHQQSSCINELNPAHKTIHII
jgi:hypothetical protein